MLPNLIVIGAAKCGTTSLHEYLDEHPEIAMSREKELRFFVEEKNWPLGAEWYAAQFDDAPIRGESTPAYTAYPRYRGVPERMRDLIPAARFVYLVRDPIERIVSHFVHRSVQWPEMGSLEQALADPQVREGFVLPSRYWLQLQRYLACFPEDQLLVVDADELRGQRNETLARIFRFLQVDPEFQSAAYERTHNRGERHAAQRRSGRVLAAALRQTVGPERAQAIKARAPGALKRPFRKKIERPTLDRSTRAELEAELRDDVQELRRHTGLAFSGWTI
ncbi:MAG: hypothetical protein QOD08_1494 [Gaiellaceae bacterium]|nr:hypothetical protein [Gaiellaceae bacterium]